MVSSTFIRKFCCSTSQDNIAIYGLVISSLDSRASVFMGIKDVIVSFLVGTM